MKTVFMTKKSILTKVSQILLQLALYHKLIESHLKKQLPLEAGIEILIEPQLVLRESC